MIKSNYFKSIKLKLASPEDILSWSFGEVTKPETINYRTQRPEKDGLFAENIFGPIKDWECYCGKYRRIRYKGIICDKCGVEVTKSSVRRERMGHIKLAAPVSHIWFLRGVPSKIGMVLDMSINNLEKVIYFSSYLITKVNQDAKERVLKELEDEFKNKYKKEKDKNKKERIKDIYDETKENLKKIKKLTILSEVAYYNLSRKFGEVFEAKMGAEAIIDVLSEINIVELRDQIKKNIPKIKDINKAKELKRLKIVDGMVNANIDPRNMFISVLPVIPPDLRPMVQLDGGRYASSDLNDLYRRVINRNNRLKKLIELNSPDIIVKNEKRMLQEAVDALIDNSARKGQAIKASTGQKRLLKSLADMLKGKYGRFRQNLLGKRVDYSGRSVIVVGPSLKLHQCGLPKRMALELFKPFIINKLIERKLAHNVRGANHLIEDEIADVWAILEEVIQNKYVLLNRAPTLHRLGVQAFSPILIEGSAIQLHPMVCRAFNADFDGDQMAVHLPLTDEAQQEARDMMLSSRGLLKPATGDPIVVPSQDIVLGCYYMTKIKEGAKGEGKVFASKNEAILAFDNGIIDINSKIKVRLGAQKKLIETSVGRIIFNNTISDNFDFINKEMNSKALEALVGDIINKYGIDGAATILDKIKSVGFKYATKSGISWGIDDLVVPEGKKDLIKKATEEVNQINEYYNQGLLTNKERYMRVIGIWTSVKAEVAKMVSESLPKEGSVYSIISSGARGSWAQPIQMSGMKGLVVNPASEVIELPILSSFKEGFNALEYFISTHGARKGTADTALKTAAAGYLTRRLVDVAQDVVVKEEDCGDTSGFEVYKEDLKEVGVSFASSITGRFLLDDISNIAIAGQLIDKDTAKKIDQLNIEKLRIRSLISCKGLSGICRKCYGYDLSNNQLVNLGEAVGIIAAQAIGEPGTQLTMRTFHTGGVAGGGDITQGLPRVEEIFEARSPKGKALISELDGKVVSIEEENGVKTVKITGTRPGETKKENLEYIAPQNAAFLVNKGDVVYAGKQLTEGHIDPKELFKVGGEKMVCRYIIKEVQRIYSSEGSSINNKHIEVIIRQMFSRVRIKDEGDSGFIEGDIIEKNVFRQKNVELKKKGKNPAKAHKLLFGITKVALTTESFLSAASFQETARVLINASIEGKMDLLQGLKENVIIGKLIPAGTGYKRRLLEERGEIEEEKVEEEDNIEY